jgi:hypothetical protein
MNRRQALVLRLFAVWTLFVWIVGIKNFVIGGHHSAGFRAIHGALAVISILLAIVAWQVVSQVRHHD